MHTLGFKTARLVVIAKKMKHRMYGQESQLPFERMPVEMGLLHRPLHRDDNITEQIVSCFLILVIYSVLAHGEGQNVGGGILIAVGPVELTDSLVIGEADADFSGELHLLISQNRIAAPLDKQPRPGRDFGLFLPVCDINLCTCQWTLSISFRFL